MHGRLDDDLLPDSATRKVVDIVHLVEDHIADTMEPLRIFVDQVSQNLRGHDDDRGHRVDRVFAGDQPDIAIAVQSAIVSILLIGERFQGRGVDRARIRLERAENGIVGDHRLARAGGGRDEHPMMGLELFDRLHLKRIQRPGQGRLEGVDQRGRAWRKRLTHREAIVRVARRSKRSISAS